MFVELEYASDLLEPDPYIGVPILPIFDDEYDNLPELDTTNAGVLGEGGGNEGEGEGDL